MADDFDQQKEALRAPWIAGDQGVLARTLGVETAENFVAQLGDITRRRVLDAACGSGGVTLPLARRGGVVTGVDIAPNLLAQARDAASAAGLAIRFDEAFVEELPYQNDSFDLVTSMFGVIFSPFPERVIAELARVLSQGGRIALANWTKNGVNAGMMAIAGRYLPPASATQQTSILNDRTSGWSDASVMRRLLDPYFTDIETRPMPTHWDMKGSPADVVDLFVKNAGPFQMMLAALSDADQVALIADITRFFAQENEAPSGSGRTRLAVEYLAIKATRRAAAAPAPQHATN